jgi:hypothetical protein
VPAPDLGGHVDADSILTSLSVMVARASAGGTLPPAFLAETTTADPTGATLCRLLERGTAAGAVFGSGFLVEAGRALLTPGAPAPYDGLRAWLDAVTVDAALALDVLEDRELAWWLLSAEPAGGASARRRSRLLSLASSGEGADRKRVAELALWARRLCSSEDAHLLTGPFDGLAVLLAGDVLALDDIAADVDHPSRPAVEESLARMRGDQLALSALADRCARFNRLRIQGVAPRDRPGAVAASCRLLTFTLRPLLGDARHGDAGETYLRFARELTAMTGLRALLRDAREVCPRDLLAAWPGAEDGRPARTGELGPDRFRDLLRRAGAAEGLVGDLVAASRAAPPAP